MMLARCGEQTVGCGCRFPICEGGTIVAWARRTDRSEDIRFLVGPWCERGAVPGCVLLW